MARLICGSSCDMKKGSRGKGESENNLQVDSSFNVLCQNDAHIFSYYKHRCAAITTYTRGCHFKNRNGNAVVHQKVS